VKQRIRSKKEKALVITRAFFVGKMGQKWGIKFYKPLKTKNRKPLILKAFGVFSC
jgi:hypothetical protein